MVVVPCVVANCLEARAGGAEMVPVLGRLVADWAVVVGDEVGGVKHVGGAEGEGKDSGEVVEKVVAGLAEFRWESVWLR